MRSKLHRDLLAWQKNTDLLLLIYRLTKSFPDQERFGLISQRRLAGVSVPSNIAVKLEYLAAESYAEALECVNKCGRILAALIRSLENKSES